MTKKDRPSDDEMERMNNSMSNIFTKQFNMFLFALSRQLKKKKLENESYNIFIDIQKLLKEKDILPGQELLALACCISAVAEKKKDLTAILQDFDSHIRKVTDISVR